MVEAIGFDLGETLLTYAGTPLNWAALYPAALARVATRCGARPDAAQVASAQQILARHNTRREEIAAADLFREILAAWGLAPEPHLADAMAAFCGFFQQRMIPYPATSTVLSLLRERGIRIGVLTDTPYGMPREFVQRDLADAGLTQFVDVLITSTDVGWRKPATTGFETLALELGVSTSALWYVGNESKDIAGARAVGLTAVLIDREGLAPAWGQDHTVRDLTALPALL